MNIILLIIDILLTIPLSYILIKIEKEKNNNIYSCIVPTIYIIIISALIPTLKKYIFLIPIFELFIRNYYLANVNEEINNNKKAILSSIISILLVIISYNYFITKVDNVLPTAEEIRPFIWIIIIYVIYTLVDQKQITSIKKTKSLLNKKEYISMQYAKNKIRYERVINSKNDMINKLVYSLIIFNNYQQPAIYRNTNNYIRHLLNKEVKYGVMQVSSPTPISDEESIKIVIKEFESIFRKSKKEVTFEQYLIKYNEEEIKEIVNIYEVINSF